MFLVVHAVTSVLVGALLLISQPALVSRFGWAGACIPLAFVLLHPKVINLLARKLAGRSGVEPPVLRWRDLVRPLAWMLPAWVALRRWPATCWRPRSRTRCVQLLVVCTGAFALGWIVGLVVFIAPAGVGAREAVLILALTPLLGVAAATTVEPDPAGRSTRSRTSCWPCGTASSAPAAPGASRRSNPPTRPPRPSRTPS